MQIQEGGRSEISLHFNQALLCRTRTEQVFGHLCENLISRSIYIGIEWFFHINAIHSATR
jgi:hypothetical protein